MNISLQSFKTYISPFSKRMMFSSLMPLQSKVLLVASVVFSALTALMIAIRYCNFKSNVMHKQVKKVEAHDLVATKASGKIQDNPQKCTNNDQCTLSSSTVLKTNNKANELNVHAKSISKKTNKFGHLCEGEFVNNQLHGKGKITYKSDCEWISDEGEFENGFLVKGTKIAQFFKFEGQFKTHELLHGTGYKNVDGHIYEGEFKGKYGEYQLNGQGKVTYAKGFYQVSNEGIFENDQLIQGTKVYIDGMEKGYFKEHPSGWDLGYILFGLGQKIDSDGTIFEGNFANGVLEGPNGKIIIGPNSKYNNGYIYEGDFEAGKLVKGKLTANGNVYQGEFVKESLKKGTITHPNGIVFDGEFDSSGYLKEGKKINKDGKIFEQGTFANNKLKKGIKVDPDGTLFDGEFNQDNKFIGKKIDVQGNVYEGDFSKNLLYKGKITYLNKNVHQGTFFDEMLCGKDGMIIDAEMETVFAGDFWKNKLESGSVKFSNKREFIGKFKLDFEKNVFHCDGKMIDADGTLYEGIFINWEPQGKVYITPTNDVKYVAKYIDGSRN